MTGPALSHYQQRLVWDTEAMLRCKVCQKRITPPVVICRIGHLTCKKCNPQNGHFCRVCNKFLISDQFVILENLLHVLPRHCQFSRQGCKQLLTGDSEHEKYCPERPTECKLGKYAKCCWKGSYHDWLEHARGQAHFQVTWWNAVENLLFVQFLDFPSGWDFYNMLLNYDSKLFMFSSYKSEEFLHLTVRYLGQNSDSDSYWFPKKMPDYSMKITFLRDSLKHFSIKLNSKDDKLSMCEEVSLSDLAPLINSHLELDMYVELSVENQRLESLGSASQNAAEIVQDFDLMML